MLRQKVPLYWMILGVMFTVSYVKYGPYSQAPIVKTVVKRVAENRAPVPDRAEFEDLDELGQDNTFLISYIRQYHLFPPSMREYRYTGLMGHRINFVHESEKTIEIIQSYLKNKTNGVFLEAGASNGADELSDTLVLERDYDWTGLLVEGSPVVFPKLIAAHRKAWKSDLALSYKWHSELSVFKQNKDGYSGKVYGKRNGDPVTVMSSNDKQPLLNYEVLTVPLYSLIAACKYTVIDFLSLDVEGGTEFQILTNFPFESVLIRTMVVDVGVMGPSRAQRLADFLSSKGYHKHPTDPTPYDMIFIHKSVMNN